MSHQSDYRRRGLTDQQELFMRVLVPFAKTTNHYTIIKDKERDDPIGTVRGMLPSVIAAFCIHRSKWGTHPVARQRYEEPLLKLKDGRPAWKHGNNIAVIHADRFWQSHRPYITYEGYKYKSYKDIAACAIDLSDIVALKPGWRKLMAALTIEEQIDCVSRHAKQPLEFKEALVDIVCKLELWELDG